MYNRAQPTAQQPRADNRHGIHSHDTAELERFPSRSRGPAAAATAPAATTSSPDHGPNSGTGTGTSTGTVAAPDHAGPVRSTLLQPRVAVALGVSKTWYPLLFLCRLVSITPGVLFGLPTALRLLATLHLMFLDRVLDGGALARLVRGGSPSATSGYDPAFEARLRLTETLLATTWCCASGYLSFFFTDCLMSRWLLNYTPQATIVRLLTVNAINGYLTSWVLHLTGGFDDTRLILPAWIIISTTLTVLYHITQRKINIRKETSMSISVFSIASFVSMVALLAQLHSNRFDYPDIPLVIFVRRVIYEAGRLAIRIMEYGDVTRGL
ncbi:hypothetical protein BT67DRAFT_49423 [Trichocladium antarcticum]|uniref:N-glycosylation protein EOS1 n=1 Tax=Trichocladium antarcticum TaxID=1450529 RepID=A0AAN6UIK9_9PEZI|nr:hypothetical protein BT67DRAFT_49423 [Trichocladium antarcticum]